MYGEEYEQEYGSNQDGATDDCIYGDFDDFDDNDE